MSAPVDEIGSKSEGEVWDGKPIRVDRETHPLYFDSNWPRDAIDSKLLGNAPHFSHLKPMSVLVTPIGNMWVENAWHRFQDMVVHSSEQIGRTVAVEEIHDNCTLPFDHIGQMRNSAMLTALDGGFDWWFMIETDVLLEVDTLERLLAWDRPVIAPLMVDDEKGSPLTSPKLKANTGLQRVIWTVNTAILFNVKVFNATGPDPWGTHFGLNEYQFFQKLAHYGHHAYVDTNTVIHVAKAPSFPRNLSWKELWDRWQAAFKRNRNEERDRRPPPSFDVIFTNGEAAKIGWTGAYMPMGRVFKDKGVK